MAPTQLTTILEQELKTTELVPASEMPLERRDSRRSVEKTVLRFSAGETLAKASAGATPLAEPTAQAGDLPSTGETLAKALAGTTALTQPTAQTGDLPSMMLDIPSACLAETRSYACSDAGFLWPETAQILLSSTPAAFNLVMEVALKW